jgi:prolipoprotein diacylglyceryltransferase
MPHVAPTMGFHDLGLYELLYLSLVIVPAFLYWSRQRRPNGFYLASFAALYFPVRFVLDMLRIADARYFGLTPAQWAVAVIMVVLPIALLRGRRRSKLVSGALVLVAACACCGGAA